MAKIDLLILFVLFPLSPVIAQELRGKVVDASTGIPLEAAAATLQRGASGAPVAFSLTDKEGRFTLPLREGDSLSIAVSYLGYRKEVKEVKHGTATYHFSLEPEALTLKEVQIKPGRIYGRQDTVKFDLSQFASSNDVNVKDVLRKLPGVEVSDEGRIKYNGREISNFTVEGMDLTGGRYNLINNNLDAKAVKEAQIIENYQPIKSLRDKVFTDDVALNLKLDPDARSKWMYSLSATTGWGEEFLRSGKGSALQLGHHGQSLYGLRTDNTGTDLSGEQHELTTTYSPTSQLSGNQLPVFLAQPDIQTPLDRKRVLFNDTHALSLNKLRKPGEESLLRIQAGYTGDKIRQEWGNRDSWYYGTDTISLKEYNDYTLRSDQGYADLFYEKNATHYYLKENLSVKGELQRSSSQINGDDDRWQRLNTHSLQLENKLHLVRNREETTSELRSHTRYDYRPSNLHTGDLGQQLTFRRLYIDNNYSFMHSRRNLTANYLIGINAELFSTRQTGKYHNHSYSLYALPSFRWNTGRWRSILSLPVQYQGQTQSPQPHLFFNPALSLRYRAHHRWTWWGYGSRHHTKGTIATLYPSVYHIDYRTQILPPDRQAQSSTQFYSLNAEYKNTVRELFFNYSLSYTRSTHNLLSGQLITDGTISLATLPLRNHSQYKSMQAYLSKGFYDWNLTTSMGITISRATGSQWDGKEVLPYRYDRLQCQPKIHWRPAAQVEITYKGDLSYGGSRIGGNTQLTPLLHMVNRLHLSCTSGRMTFQLSGESYLDEISENKHKHIFLTDASVLYIYRRWRATASLRNLLNYTEYRYTTYSTIVSRESWLTLRPREYLISLLKQF